MTNYPAYFPGDLVEIIEARDQSLYIKKHISKIGLIEKRLHLEITSSPNMYKVHIEENILHLHAADLKLLSRVKDD